MAHPKCKVVPRVMCVTKPKQNNATFFFEQLNQGVCVWGAGVERRASHTCPSTFCAWERVTLSTGSSCAIFEQTCATIVESTGPVCTMSHRKWRETKQQLIGLPDLALLGCCLVSLPFLWDILHTGNTGSSYSLYLTFFWHRFLFTS